MQTNHLPIARQAITTKYHGPTNTRGSRISATAAAGRVYVYYRHELSLEENHHEACRALAKKLDWGDEWIPGCTHAGDYVWITVPSEYQRAVNAVVLTRVAMRKGENNGNPHCRPFGKAVDSLTEESDGDAFSAAFSGLYKEALKDIL